MTPEDYSDYAYRIAHSEENWFKEIEITDEGKAKNRTVFPQRPAKKLTEAYKFKTLPSQTLYRFDDDKFNGEGIWKPDGEIIVGLECDHMFSPSVGATKSKVASVVSWIKRHTIIRGEYAPQPPKHLIPLQDKLLDINTWKFVPYSPKYFFTGKIDVYVDPRAKCSNFLKFLSEASNPKDIKLLQEWMGYCMLPDYCFKKALGLLGPPNTGKTTFFNVLETLLGELNYSSVSLKTLTENIFAPDQLYGKLANIDADLMEIDEAIKSVSMFKKLTGRDSIDAQKKFKEPYKFRNYAKLCFGANQLPDITKADDAYYDRWMIIFFNNVVPKGERDAYLIDKLTTDEELRGILRWSLKGLKRLLERGHFDYDLTTERVKALYLRNTSSIEAFLQDKTVLNRTAVITKEDLYKAYDEYCYHKNEPSESISKFGRELKKRRVVRSIQGRFKSDGTTCEAWRGLELADE